MSKSSKIINKEAWRDIYRLELSITRLEKVLIESREPNVEEEGEDYPAFKPRANFKELKARELHEHRRLLWQLKRENPTEPLGKELLEILESMRN